MHMRYPFSRQSLKMALVAAALFFLAAAAGSRLYAVDLSTAIVEVAKKNIPAVVHIEVTERKEVANPLLPFEKDPLLRRFFGNRRMPKNSMKS